MIKLVLANKPAYLEHIRDILEDVGELYRLAQPGLQWFLMVDEDRGAVGAAYLFALSDVRWYIDILGLEGHDKRRQAAVDLVDYLRDNHMARKLESAVPLSNQRKLKYLRQVGFLREGVAKASAEDGRELVDQQHLGMAL
jgi:hypothetical protein